jgi:hypothetical protein
MKWLNILHFCSLFFTALALSAAMAHLLELPNKILLPQREYQVVQQIYRGWALLAIVVIGAFVSTALLAYQVRGEGWVFSLFLTALVCIVATQILFWIFTYPANQQTHNWTFFPENWQQLRTQWEYSHAAGAILDLIAFSALVLSLLVRSK